MEGPPTAQPPGGDPLGAIPKPTLQLRAILAEQRQALSPVDFAEMTAEITGLYQKYCAALEATPRGAERGRALHRMMDAAVDTASAVPISCKKGCYGCCHSEVEVTPDEVEVLLEVVLSGTSVDRKRLEVQAAREPRSPEWAKFWSTENRCVFLDGEGACRIYADRPAACRKLIVTSPPEACTTLGATVRPVRMLFAEILLSAALSFEADHLRSISWGLHPRLPPVPAD